MYYTASGIITPAGDRPVHRLREVFSQLICALSWLITKIKRSQYSQQLEGSPSEYIYHDLMIIHAVRNVQPLYNTYIFQYTTLVFTLYDILVH